MRFLVAKSETTDNFHREVMQFPISNFFLQLNNFFTLLAVKSGSNLEPHNCQKWKKKVDSYTCSYHKIYRVKAVGLSLFNYTFKITI